MELTREKIDKLMTEMSQAAKLNRERMGYSSQNFEPVALVIGPRLEHAITSLRHNSNEEKRAKTRALAMAARETKALAIVLVADARWSHADKFGAYFHIPPMEEIGLDAWTAQYYEILNGIYGGTLENCPREVWDEAVVVSIKGPAIEPEMRFFRYEKGPRDSVVWLEDGDTIKDKSEVSVKINMLPDWWEEPTGRPA
jgi:hypothetical protein